MDMPFVTKKNNGGFTLIELLIVVVVLGILAGITIVVLNPSVQRNRAKDAVNLKNIEGLAQGIESYMAMEGGYPVDTNNNRNPLDDNSGLDIYITSWPGSNFYYYRSGDTFCVYVQSVKDSTRYLKYASPWGKIKNCSGTNISTISTCSSEQTDL